ncbi:MAG TPA: SMI1/KNR4 family protein [Streptosporangiaceae bacterium]|nr:SMI1/KNR4 family protein [Streptosporangiaceae bacterium]
MLEHLGWLDLLRRWSGEAIAHADAVGLEVTPGMRASGWIGVPPASAADVAAVQARLNRSLPQSYQAFLAITNGWPVLSFDFGWVRPVAELDWVAAADPGFYEVVCAECGHEWPPDSDDGPPLMDRALLLSSGTDSFLYDTGRLGADGEWATTCWTSWYPGAGDQQPSFRAGLESHYASFVRFEATDSVTHAEVAAQVEDAYQRALRGDRSREGVISEAGNFGSARADILEAQLNVLNSQYHAAVSVVTLAGTEDAADPAMLTDLWPMLVVAATNPRDQQQWALDQALGNAEEPVADLLRSLADQCQREGGLVAGFGYAPGFATAMGSARLLARAGRDTEAFEAILSALPSWRPLSPLHMAPMGLTWDRDLGRIMTPERRDQLLATARRPA